MRRRVVITGLGIICPVGNDIDTSWNNLLAGKSGIAPITDYDTEGLATKFAGQIKNFDNSSIDSKDLKKMDQFIQYGMVAADQAIADSGIDLDKIDRDRFGVAVGSGIGGIKLIESTCNTVIEKGYRRISPFFIPASIINMISGDLSVKYQLRGPNYAVTTACTTGTHNIGLAARQIAYGDADYMLAGGAECASNGLGMGGFNALRALSTRNDDPEAASRPWDVDRDGFILADGAGVVLLESLEHAIARGAKIYGEITGFGMSCDGYHMTSPPENGEGAAASMRNALKDANLDYKDIDYINAHGTSTPVGDLAEAKAIMSIWGENPEKLLVSSTKSMTGHLLGAAGGVEFIFTTLAVYHDIAPPTINVVNQEPAVKLDLVKDQPRKTTIKHALSNNFGFGGTNGSLIISKYQA